MRRHWLITQGRIVKAGMQNFIRNATLAVAAIAVMVITLTIILTSVIASAAFNNSIKQITDKIDISLYLNDDVSDDRREELIRNLEARTDVKEVRYLTKEEALEKFKNEKRENLNTLLAISQLDDNPIPATINIRPVDPDRLEGIRNYLERPEIKELQSAPTSYSGPIKNAIDKISKSAKFLRQAGIAGVIVFAFVSMLIIFNTIRMAIFNRRDELTIMRLLGASSWYIRGPFVVETIIYGIVSAILSVTLVNTLFKVSSSAFEASSLGLLDISFADTYFTNHFWLILTAQLGIGILIGAASSVIATRRYLKFKTSK